uniref:Sulfotransferase domain-containing protein n=1 Tax=Glossina pallidipes TaxID=7398 RepID=A0A1B0ABJ6_GLOPL
MSTANESSESATASLLTTGVTAGGSVKTRTPHQRITFTTKRRKMSRRANLIGICGVSGLCILLLIATTQHRPLPASLASSSAAVGAVGSGSLGGNAVVGSYSSAGNGFGAGSVYAGDRFNRAMPQQTAVVYNVTATIADVLAAQRAKIVVEMEYFDYPSGRFGVDAEKLADLTPETEGTPVRSLIVASWRSGSTFLGDILNAMPGNYYHYEPLLNFGIKQIRDPDEQELALKNLKNLLFCDYNNQMEDFLEYGKMHTYLFEHNERLWTVCKEYPHYCWRPKFLTRFCKLFPLQSMKTVRLRLSTAERLLEDKRSLWLLQWKWLRVVKAVY